MHQRYTEWAKIVRIANELCERPKMNKMNKMNKNIPIVSLLTFSLNKFFLLRVVLVSMPQNYNMTIFSMI